MSCTRSFLALRALLGVAVLLGVISLLSSCGGSSAGPTPPAETGQIQITVRFPTEAGVSTAALPYDTSYIFVRITAADFPTPVTTTLYRGSGDTVTDTLTVRSGAARHVYVEAWDNGGYALATGATNVDVLPGETATAHVTVKNECWVKVGTLVTTMTSGAVCVRRSDGDLYLLQDLHMLRVKPDGTSSFCAAPPGPVGMACVAGDEVWAYGDDYGYSTLYRYVMTGGTWATLALDSGVYSLYTMYSWGGHIWLLGQSYYSSGPIYEVDPTTGTVQDRDGDSHWDAPCSVVEFGSELLVNRYRYSMDTRAFTPGPALGDANCTIGGVIYRCSGRSWSAITNMTTLQEKKLMPCPVGMIVCGAWDTDAIMATDGSGVWKYIPSKDTYEG